MKVRKTLLVLSALCCLFLVACREKTEELIFDYDELKITPSTTKALIEGDYISSTDINRISVVYGEDPKLLDAFIKNTEIESNRFSVMLTDLDVNTQYYYCLECSDENRSIRTSILSFSTLEVSCCDGEIGGYEYVDLGLPSGLKWATCNVGSTLPTDYGDYFAWGETEIKEEYNVGNSLTHGINMDDISGNSNYDVVRKKWGNTWRMPTKEEMQELADYCEWEWVHFNGINGIWCTGLNGNYIFLPATQFSSGIGSGHYWCSTPDTDYYRSYNLSFYPNNVEVFSWFRFNGLPVRPVTE